MELHLRGKRALVTGASSGVGRAIALALAAEGAHVAIGYRSGEDKAKQVLKQIEQMGRPGAAIRANLASPEDCRILYEKAEAALGGLDILVNNAGSWPKHWVQDIPLDEWNATIGVNLTSVFLLSQLFIQRRLAAKAGGKILNITSQAAFRGSTTGHAHYAASKAGVVAFTVSTAREVGMKDIQVNAIALGIVETPMVEAALHKDPAYYVSRIPRGRVARPEEIADIAAFLVSARADYITGATIDATGGMLMR